MKNIKKREDSDEKKRKRNGVTNAYVKLAIPLPRLKRNCKCPRARFKEMKSPRPFFIWPLYSIRPLVAFGKKKTSIAKAFLTLSKRGNCI